MFTQGSLTSILMNCYQCLPCETPTNEPMESYAQRLNNSATGSLLYMLKVRKCTRLVTNSWRALLKMLMLERCMLRYKKRSPVRDLFQV